MIKFFIPLIIAAIFCATSYESAQASEQALNQSLTKSIHTMLRMSIGKNEIIVALDDNAASANFLKILPLEIEFRDYNGTEKIADLPKKLNTGDAPTSCDPVAGSFTYFIPWGNLAIFYRDFRHSNNLVPLGRIISGMEYLKNMKGNFMLRIEQINKHAKGDN